MVKGHKFLPVAEVDDEPVADEGRPERRAQWVIARVAVNKKNKQWIQVCGDAGGFAFRHQRDAVRTARLAGAEWFAVLVAPQPEFIEANIARERELVDRVFKAVAENGDEGDGA